MLTMKHYSQSIQVNVNNKVFVLIPTIYHYQINMDNMPQLMQ